MTTSVRIGLMVGLLTATCASSKELPRGRAAQPQTSACAAFGPGFRKLEGSDSCLKVGGSVRVESSYGSGGGFPSMSKASH